MIRLFGDNTQDSSLSFHIGKFVLDYSKPTSTGDQEFNDWYWSGFLQIYFWHWFGILGEYRDFGSDALVGEGGFRA